MTESETFEVDETVVRPAGGHEDDSEGDSEDDSEPRTFERGYAA